MSAIHTRAPTLAWFLAALTCLLVGLAIVESRYQAVALTHPVGARLPSGEAVTGEGAVQPAATPKLTPRPDGHLPLTTHIVDAPMPRATGPAILRVARLTVPPGGVLPPEVASGLTVLLVESGNHSVWIDGDVWVELGLEVAATETALSVGEQIVIADDAKYNVRNDGSTPAEALVVSVVPGATPTPMLGPGEQPLPTAHPGAACHCP